MNKNKSILLIDNNVKLRECIALDLESQGYDTVQVNDGTEALNKFRDKKWYCIVCDLQIPHISGVMLLKIIRERGIKIPMIFITALIDTPDLEQAYKLGVQAIITKPFEAEDLFQKLIDVKSYNDMVNHPEAETVLEDHYCKIFIDEFVSGKKNLYPVFLKLSSSKFIKIAHTGEDLDQKKIDAIKKYGVEYFYLENNDYYSYLKGNIVIARSLLGFREIKDVKKREFFIGITKNIIEFEFHRNINSETLAMSFLAIHNTLKLVSKKRDLFKALQDLHNFSKTIVETSILSSLIASAIALQSKEFNNKTVLNVLLAALYQDFGFKELPKELLEISMDKMTIRQLQCYKGHPQLSAQLMSSIKEIPEVVTLAILHHHEHSDGSGYPFGVGRVKMHPIARILAITDFLVTNWSIQENRDSNFETILQLIKDKSEFFDRNYIAYALELITDPDQLLKTNF